jgi:hypothetical protein
MTTVFWKKFCGAIAVSCLTVAMLGCGPSDSLVRRVNAMRICRWQLTFWKTLPPAEERDADGRATCSWRFSTEFDEGRDGHDSKLPWDSPELARFRATVPNKYCFGGTPETNVVAVVGNGTAFHAEVPLLVSDLPCSLILLVEITGSSRHWMEPGDLDLRDLTQSLIVGDGERSLGTERRGFLVGFGRETSACEMDLSFLRASDSDKSGGREAGLSTLRVLR